jgi:hypothetical protein
VCSRKITPMKTNFPSWTTLVLSTHTRTTDTVDSPIIVGFGMLTVTKTGRDDWSFALNAEVADTLADKPAMLTRLADALPQPDFVIADQLDARVFSPLELAADRAGTVVAAYLRLRVARLCLALPVDLAAGRARRAGPLPYAEPLQLPPPVTIAVDGVAIVDTARARTDLERRVIADWLSFLNVPQCQPHGPACGTAALATITWMTACKEA